MWPLLYSLGLKISRQLFPIQKFMVREKSNSKGPRNTSLVFNTGENGSEILWHTVSQASEKAPNLVCIPPEPLKKNGLQERLLWDCGRTRRLSRWLDPGQGWWNEDAETGELGEETRHLSAQDGWRFNCKRADSRHPATPHGFPGPPGPSFPYTSAIFHLTTSQFLKGAHCVFKVSLMPKPWNHCHWLYFIWFKYKIDVLFCS